MASIGILLKKEREKKKISLSDVSQETKIGTKYLKALETDNYTIFPGETYVIGFMRNYARALGLDPSDIINQYKSTKIGEVESENVKAEKEQGEIMRSIAANKKAAEEMLMPSSKKADKIKTSKKGDIEVVELPEEEIPVKKNKREEAYRKEEIGSKLFKTPLKENKFLNMAHLIIGGGVVVGLILLIIIVSYIVGSLKNSDKDKIYTNLNEIKFLEFSGNLLQTDFVENEYYNIQLGGKTHNILFEKLTELSDVKDADKPENEKSLEFAFHFNDITIPVKLKEDKSFDFDYDSQNDLKLKVISYKEDLINARIEKLHSFIAVQSNENELEKADAGTNKKMKKAESSKSSSEGVKKDRIVLTAVVREKTYIKAFIDGKEQEGVIYYPKDKVRLEANDVLQLKIGNAGGIVAKINGKLTKLGKRGEIANKVITWQRDQYDDSVYNLIIKDWQ